MKPKLLHIILMLAAMASLSQASFAQDAMQNDNDTTDFGKYKDILLESQKLAQDGNYKAAIEAANKYQSLDLQNRDSIASQELAIQNEKLNNIQRENENSRIAIQNAKLMLEKTANRF